VQAKSQIPCPEKPIRSASGVRSIAMEQALLHDEIKSWV
jgi:hypothetical protein